MRLRARSIKSVYLHTSSDLVPVHAPRIQMNEQKILSVRTDYMHTLLSARNHIKVHKTCGVVSVRMYIITNFITTKFLQISRRSDKNRALEPPVNNMAIVRW